MSPTPTVSVTKRGTQRGSGNKNENENGNGTENVIENENGTENENESDRCPVMKTVSENTLLYL